MRYPSFQNPIRREGYPQASYPLFNIRVDARSNTTVNTVLHLSNKLFYF